LTTTSLGRRVLGDQFPQVVARRIRGVARQSRKSLGDSPFVNNHVRALTALADLVVSAGLDDQLVRTLQLAHIFSGGDSGTWSPREQTLGFMASCGLGPATPTAEESLAELVSVAVEDLVESRRAAAKAGAAAHMKMTDMQESNTTMSKELAAAKESEEELRKELAEARQGEAEARMTQVNHLRRALDADITARPTTGAEPKPEKKKEPRRVRVEGAENEGVYTVTRKVGPNDFDTALEIGFKDAAGKQRWRRLDHTDLERARAERAELHHTKEPAAAA
jgi:hypothetical protein